MQHESVFQALFANSDQQMQQEQQRLELLNINLAPTTNDNSANAVPPFGSTQGSPASRFVIPSFSSQGSGFGGASSSSQSQDFYAPSCSYNTSHSTSTSNSGSSLFTFAGCNLKAPLPRSFRPTIHHVICGRGKKCYGHVGNRHFLNVVVASHIDAYAKAETKLEKSDIVQRVVCEVEVKGGFVRLDNKTGDYYVAAEQEGREKTSQALRDCLKHKYKSSKDIKRRNRKTKRLMMAQQVLHQAKDDMIASSESSSASRAPTPTHSSGLMTWSQANNDEQTLICNPGSSQQDEQDLTALTAIRHGWSMRREHQVQQHEVAAASRTVRAVSASSLDQHFQGGEQEDNRRTVSTTTAAICFPRLPLRLFPSATHAGGGGAGISDDEDEEDDYLAPLPILNGWEDLDNLGDIAELF